VLITFRCILRLDPPALEGVRNMLAQQLALNKARCEVELLAWAVHYNYIHLLIYQRFDGHCPKGHKGIAPFLRNVISVTARYANTGATLQARFLERTYEAHHVSDPSDLIRFLARIHGQPAKHRLYLETVRETLDSCAQVLSYREPDGSVEKHADHPDSTGLDLEARCERFHELIEDIVEAVDAEERRVAAFDDPNSPHPRLQFKVIHGDDW
jgi:REP element-mobilizing transposase RayT